MEESLLFERCAFDANEGKGRGRAGRETRASLKNSTAAQPRLPVFGDDIPNSCTKSTPLSTPGARRPGKDGPAFSVRPEEEVAACPGASLQTQGWPRPPDGRSGTGWSPRNAPAGLYSARRPPRRGCRRR